MQKARGAAVATASAAELRLGSFLCVLLHHDYECAADEGEVSKAKRQQQCRYKARGNQKNSRRPPPCFQALQQAQPSGQTQAGVRNQINIYYQRSARKKSISMRRRRCSEGARTWCGSSRDSLGVLEDSVPSGLKTISSCCFSDESFFDSLRYDTQDFRIGTKDLGLI